MKKQRRLRKAVDPISLSITILIIASLLLFNVLPLVKVLIQSFTDAEGTYSFGGYIRAFQFKQNRDAMVHTLVSSLSAAAIATVIGFIFTWVIFYPLIANNVWIKLCFIRLGGLQYVYPKRRSLLSLS